MSKRSPIAANFFCIQNRDVTKGGRGSWIHVTGHGACVYNSHRSKSRMVVERHALHDDWPLLLITKVVNRLRLLVTPASQLRHPLDAAATEQRTFVPRVAVYIVHGANVEPTLKHSAFVAQTLFE